MAGLLERDRIRFGFTADQAACAGSFDETSNRHTWIIEPTAELSTPASVLAKLEICDGCPVRVECLRHGLEASFVAYGIWGGTTTIQRLTLAPRQDSSGFGYAGERREQIRRAETILLATHDERLRKWRRFAQEARWARARGENVQGPAEPYHAVA